MRRKDFRGLKVCTGACSLRRLWRAVRVLAVKISGAWRLVTRRVLDGGEGCIKGGRVDRSMERPGLVRRRREGGCWAGEAAGGADMSIVRSVAM